jgi:hypothetical protein
MLKKLSSIIVAAFVMALAVVPTLAQEMLEPGTPVTGELTDEIAANEYTFEGLENQVVIIGLSYIGDSYDQFNYPGIILRDSAGTEIMSNYGYYTTMLVWQLPADDTYTVVATRTDDTADGAPTVGEYQLLLTLPTELTMGEATEAEISSLSTPHYYVITSEDFFTMSIIRGGDFALEFTVNDFNTEDSAGQLSSIVTISGKYAYRGLVGDIPAGTYIVQVGQGAFDFYDEEVTANYTIFIQLSE